jgi:hypothetical protein
MLRRMDAASRLERIVGVALGAQALALQDPAALDEHLASIDPDFVGFGIEGGSMGLTMLAHKDPASAGHMESLRTGRWAPFAVLMHAGAGLALGELGASASDYAAGLNDLRAGFVIDGYGFHLGFVAPAEHLAGQPWPAGVDGAAGRVLDNGLARALWFGSGADPAGVVTGVSRFAPERHGDLWAGVAFAATYAGGLSDDGLAILSDAAGPSRAMLAAGSALAAHVRVQCANLVPAVAKTCEAVTGRSAEDADRLCVEAQSAITPGDTSVEAFVAWRDRIAELWTARVGAS